ncbi:MAG: putative O-acyltransferase [Frankiales bacterium]|nr:putative O-acyltransferase [Frankiales bacterium]
MNQSQGSASVPSRFDALTGVRFIAAAGVVLFHLGVLWHQPAPRWMTEYGHLGVPFFFTLSGFVLTWSFRAATPTALFWWHRFARVWPLHAVCFVLAAVLVLAHGAAFNGTLAALNLLLLHAWAPAIGDNLSFNPVSWTLSCEAAFYASFPVLLSVLGRVTHRRRVPLAIACLGFQAGLAGLLVLGIGGDAGRHWAQYAPAPVQGLSFVLGMLTALGLRDGWRTRVPVAAPVAVTGAALVLVQQGLGGHVREVSQRPLLDVIATAGACLIIARIATRTIQGRRQALASPLAVRLGSWSFALYLVHVLVMDAVRDAGFLSARAGYAACVFALGAAGLLFSWVERPTERWLRAHPPSGRRTRGVAVRTVASSETTAH